MLKQLNIMITIDKGSKILGYSIVGVRDFIRYFVTTSVPKSVLKKLNINSEKEFNTLLNSLIENDYIEVIKHKHNGKTYKSYEATDKGLELCRAKCVKRMTRDKADEVLSGIMKRVVEVNENPYYLYKITNFVLFGSFITDKESLGDIDISFDLEFKDTSVSKENYEELMINKRRAHENNCVDLLSSLVYGKSEVEKFIKNKSPRIHIVPMYQIESMGCDFKKIEI